MVVRAGAQAISGGGIFSVVLKTDGSLWAAGENGHGELGDGTSISRNTFVKAVSARPNPGGYGQGGSGAEGRARVRVKVKNKGRIMVSVWMLVRVSPKTAG